MIDRGELHFTLSDRNYLELLAIESPAGSHANRRIGGVFRLDGLNHVAPIREGVSNNGIDAHVFEISGFVFEHQGQHRYRSVAWSAVQFQGVSVTPDDDLEMDRVGVVFLRVDGVSCHRPDVVQDTGEVFSVADGLVNDGPNRIGAGHGHLPLVPNDFELGEIDEDTVRDGLLSTVGIDDWSEWIVVFLHFELPPGSCWIGPLWTVIPYCRLADFRHCPKSSADEVPRRRAPQRGGNEGPCTQVECGATTLTSGIHWEKPAGSNPLTPTSEREHRHGRR